MRHRVRKKPFRSAILAGAGPPPHTRQHTLSCGAGPCPVKDFFRSLVSMRASAQGVPARTLTHGGSRCFVSSVYRLLATGFCSTNNPTVPALAGFISIRVPAGSTTGAT